LDESFLAQHQSDRPLVAILPGSRTQEVESNLPMMLESARRLSNRRPAVRFAVAAYKNRHAVLAREILVRDTADSDLPVDIFVKRTPELIHQAVCCLAVSGSISLELLYHAKPTVIVYRISRLAYAAQFLLRRVKYISLVNLLSAQHIFRSWSRRDSEPGEVIYPEYLTCRDRSPEIADQLLTWIENDAARGECIERLETLRDRLGSCGASQRGATYILRALSRKSRKAHSQKSLRKAA